jgi:hypothetical protein
MTSEVPILRMLIRRCRLWLLECSSRLPGFLDIEMDDARDDSWRATFMVWIYLVAKPSHVGGRCGWARLSSALSYSS